MTRLLSRFQRCKRYFWVGRLIAELKRELEEREKEKISKLPPFLLRETAEPTVTRAIELLKSKEKILRQYFEKEYTEIMEKLRNLLSEIRKYE